MRGDLHEETASIRPKATMRPVHTRDQHEATRIDSYHHAHYRLPDQANSLDVMDMPRSGQPTTAPHITCPRQRRNPRRENTERQIPTPRHTLADMDATGRKLLATGIRKSLALLRERPDARQPRRKLQTSAPLIQNLARGEQSRAL